MYVQDNVLPVRQYFSGREIGNKERAIDPEASSRFTWQTSSFKQTLHFPPSASQRDMDFSQLNAAEQAQMSRILEKKQVYVSRHRIPSVR